MVDESFEFLIGAGVFQFPECIGQAPVMPFVVLGVLGVKAVPKGVAQLGMVAGDGPDVGKLVAEGYDL